MITEGINIHCRPATAWNIHGTKSKILKNRLADSEFIENIKNSDVVALTELHCNEEIAPPVYVLVKQKISKTEHKGQKISGGIGIYKMLLELFLTRMKTRFG